MTNLHWRHPLKFADTACVAFLTSLLHGLILPTAATSGDTLSLRERTPWTTSHIHGTPEPPDPYILEDAFHGIRFDSPLAIAAIPDSSDFLIAEQFGRVFLLTTHPQPKKRLILDTGRPLLGIVVHPDFQANGTIFLTSVAKADAPDGSWLSRLTIRRNSEWTDSDHVLASEEKILEWPAGGHNGGCLRFGPDGYLYMSTGDGSAWHDWNKTGQRIDDLLASIIRIDVNNSSEDSPYAIPDDNPFVDLPGAQPEVWSYGHRNVWKFSFDANGILWAGDVGQDLWELLLHVEKGGNYGWSVTEGSHSFNPERESGPTPILKPLVEHPHSDFRSITGGYVWTSPSVPDLVGHYIYGDYDTGRIWSLKYSDGRIQQQRQLVNTQFRVVAFAETCDGEVLVLDHISGTLQQLVTAPPAKDHPEFPRLLSQTGLFSSMTDHRPAPGVLPYSVNSPLWSDGAVKDRFLAVPGTEEIEFDGTTYPTAPPGWRFPDGTVLVKTFSVEMETGNTDSLRRLETRLLHHKRMPGNAAKYGAQVWYGYTYFWNDQQTDAELLDASGLDLELMIRDLSAPDGLRRQTWHFPSRTECALCHTMPAKYVLGINTAQMNRVHTYDNGESVNQIQMLQELGMFTADFPEPLAQLPRLADPVDASESLDRRARSYLHANCSHCHRLWGGGLSDMNLPYDVPLELTGTLNISPKRGSFELPDAALIVPGQADRSVLLHRMTRLGLGRMPHIASSQIDQAGVKLIRDWINGISGE